MIDDGPEPHLADALLDLVPVPVIDRKHAVGVDDDGYDVTSPRDEARIQVRRVDHRLRVGGHSELGCLTKHHIDGGLHILEELERIGGADLVD